MIVIPASLRSDFIHMAGMTIHIALESTIHIVGIRTRMGGLVDARRQGDPNSRIRQHARSTHHGVNQLAKV